jgi:hypothetical protein
MDATVVNIDEYPPGVGRRETDSERTRVGAPFRFFYGPTPWLLIVFQSWFRVSGFGVVSVRSIQHWSWFRDVSECFRMFRGRRLMAMVHATYVSPCSGLHSTQRAEQHPLIHGRVVEIHLPGPETTIFGGEVPCPPISIGKSGETQARPERAAPKRQQYANTFSYENSIFHAWPKCTLRKFWLVFCLSLNSIFILS